MIPKEYNLLVYGSLTLLAMALIGETLHLFLPLNGAFFLSVFVLMIVYWVVISYPSKSEYVFYTGVVLALLGLIPLLWHNYYDTGLYHLQAMRWITEYPVQFGLANVHYRLGYNSIWFTMEAMVDQHVLSTNLPFFILNAIVVFIYSLPVIKVIRKPELKTSDIFYLLSFAPILAFGGIFLTSASPDLFVMILCFTVFTFLVKEYEEPSRDLLFFALLMSAFAGMVKASMLLLFVMVLAVYLYRYQWKHIWIIPLIFIPWIINGIITSGYLLYPFSFTQLPVEWSVPVSIAVKDASDIVTWAWEYGYYIPVIIEATLLIIISLIFFRKKRDSILIPLAIATAGVFAWMITAPEPRYGLGFIFTVPLLLLASGFTDNKNRMRYISILLCLGLIQGVLIYLVFLHTNVPFTFPQPINDQVWNSILS